MQQDRFRRSRLARRRPRPVRVRRRSRTSIDWVKWGTLLSTSVAALGLLLTAIATYWSVQTANDQLEQSVEDSEKESRQQAALVSVWDITKRGGSGVGVIVNRSLDPIYHGQVNFSIADSGSEASDRRDKFAISLGTVPPCSRIELTPDFMKKAGPYKGSMLHAQVFIEALTFADAKGKSWARTPERLEEAGPPGKYPIGSRRFLASNEFGALSGEPERAEGCGVQSKLG